MKTMMGGNKSHNRSFAVIFWMTLVAKNFPVSAADGKHPHILMIVMDDLGSHDLGFHGTGIHTPHTDELARQGVYLDQYYVLPTCSPTRTALLSSKYPIHTGVWHWIWSKSTMGLPLSEETLPQVLRRAGYAAHAVGKWHAGHSAWEQTPTWRGFESFYGFYGGGEDYFSHINDGMYDLRWDAHEFCNKDCTKIVDERGSYSTHVFVREAVRRIHEHSQDQTKKDQPLFLYLAFQAVHCPNQVPKEYMKPYANYSHFSEKRKNYAGMLTAADEGISNVTQALRDAGLWEDTLIVFTTDNGGPTETCCVQGSSNYPRRGGKGTIWQGGTTGDGFISGPALQRFNMPVGRRFPHLFHVVDWLPTLAEMVGVVPAHYNELDGKSQWSGLLGTADSPARQEIYVGYVKNEISGKWYGPAIRVGNWKLLQGHSGGPDAKGLNPPGTDDAVPGGISNSSYLLYDLEKDSAEENDLSAEYPKIVQQLRYKLELYQQSYVQPQSNDDSTCHFPGPAKTKMGPTLMPWCQAAKQIVVYE